MPNGCEKLCINNWRYVNVVPRHDAKSLVAAPIDILATMPAEPKSSIVRAGSVKATPIVAPRAINILGMALPILVEVLARYLLNAEVQSLELITI